MGVYGLARRPETGGPAVRIHEGLPVEPTDIYGATKVVAEELSRDYARRGVLGRRASVRHVRPRAGGPRGDPVPVWRCRQDDVAVANILALQRLLDGPADLHLGALNIESAVPWQADDGHALREAPMAVIARYWPDGPSLLAGAGAAPWGPINESYDIGRAAEVLGWRPRRNFSEYLADVRSGAASPVPRDGLPPPD